MRVSGSMHAHNNMTGGGGGLGSDERRRKAGVDERETQEIVVSHLWKRNAGPQLKLLQQAATRSHARARAHAQQLAAPCTTVSSSSSSSFYLACSMQGLIGTEEVSLAVWRTCDHG